MLLKSFNGSTIQKLKYTFESVLQVQLFSQHNFLPQLPRHGNPSWTAILDRTWAP